MYKKNEVSYIPIYSLLKGKTMLLTFEKSPVLFIGSKPEVKAVYSYTDGKRSEFQQLDEATNHPIWSFDAEVIVGEEVEQMRIKIVSLNEPKLTARAEHTVIGKVQVKPYVQQATGRIAYSTTIYGSLEVKK